MVALACAIAFISCLGSAPESGPVVRERFPVVIILVDALRADRIDRRDGDTAIAPNLAGFAKDAVTFRRAFAGAPKTVPSVPQLFTSRWFPDIQRETTLLTVWRAAGYDRTAAFVHNPYVTKWLGRLDPTFDHLSGGDFDARKLTDDAADWLRARTSDRVALYVHYLDVHTPLTPPPDIAERFVDPAYRGPIGLEFRDTAGAWAGRYGPEDQKRIAQLYDASLAATDAEIGRLFRVLGDEGLYDRSLIVVTSDHGEELWDHGGYFHGHTLYDELLHVPLLVKFPGGWRAGSDSDLLASTLDVLPTVADLLSRDAAAPFEAPRLDGRSLVALLTGAEDPAPRTLFATVGRVDDRSPPLHSVRDLESKLIVDARDGSEQLFDLTGDPDEKRNLIAAGTEDSSPVRARLREALARYMKPLADTGFHVRLTNGTSSPVGYELATSNTFGDPVVNVARFDMERDDTLGPTPKAEGLVVKGTLAPGDSDELRYDLLSTTTTVTATLTVEGRPAEAELCVAAEAACAPSEGGKVKLSLERLQTAVRPPARPASGLQMHWWSVPGESEPITPKLSEADRERLRAIGYTE